MTFLSPAQEAKDVLHHNFKMKDLGVLRYFLGIEFARSKSGILMNQRRYAMELVSDSGLTVESQLQLLLNKTKSIQVWSMKINLTSQMILS